MNYTPFHKNFEHHNTFFTGCIHFNHKNIVKGESDWKEGFRDFNTREEMNSLLLSNINNIVPYNGHLFVLGDMFFGDKKLIPFFMERINCKNIYYIYGNHCDFLRKHKEYHKYFSWMGDYCEIFYKNKRICMSHYPAIVWNESHKGSWYLHSHCHASLPYNPYNFSLEVGVDCVYNLYNYREERFIVKSDTNGRVAKYFYGENPQNPQIMFYPHDLKDVKNTPLNCPLHPFHMDTIADIMKLKSWNQIDHHNKETN